MVNSATHFCTAQSVERPTIESVWETTLTSWVADYNGWPKNFFSDDGSQFRDFSEDICRIVDVEENLWNKPLEYT